MSFKVLTETEQLNMEHQILSYASRYAQALDPLVQLIDEGKEDVIKSPTYENDGIIEVTFYTTDGQRRKTEEIKDSLINLAKEVTGDQTITNYHSLESDMEEFRKMVSCSLAGNWYIVYSPINDILIARLTRKEKTICCST